ncbi:MAG: DEAD/DEAH box helicase [Epsilonproteobacteria bacterium]|nr:DEAD/DEAH box helicase [Campylobacterota bacterium]
MSFSMLKEPLRKAISELGFKEPSPIQKEAIPLILQGKDLVAQAHTGTGKTAAFSLPILDLLQFEREVEALILVPTRELALQVSEEVFKLGKYLRVKTATIYGGSSYSRQLRHLKTANVAVATPGRLLDLLESGRAELNPRFVVLDEADEMLDMGFLEEIEKILSYLPTNRQTLLFSATMPKEVKELAKKRLHSPTFISLSTQKVTTQNVKQFYYVVEEKERDEALTRLLDYKEPKKGIIFCRTKLETRRLEEYLTLQGYSTKALHGDIPQRQREESIKGFKGGKYELLIATDVAARGLDISDVTHVFNYHIPFDPQSYVHRIGRTGRAGRKGEAISLVTPHEFKQLLKIKKVVGDDLINQKIPTFSEVKDQKRKLLTQKILSTPIASEAIEMLNLLESQTDLSTISLKLLSLILKKPSSKKKPFNKEVPKKRKVKRRTTPLHQV